ncbi:TPA: ClpP-like prohead protease/major capsid protein fusion protein [Escherichia coli]
MAILDDVIGVFSPGWKAARLRSRAVIQAYEAVKTTRTHKARRENRTADQLSQYGAVSLREQARYLDNNHDLVIGVFDKLEERVVGKNGIIVEPHPVLRNGAIARDLAAEIRTRWSEWSVSPEVTGQFTRPMLERLMLRTWLRDGEVFAQMVSGRINSLTPSAGVHFWLEALEPDFIPMTSDESNRLNPVIMPENTFMMIHKPFGFTGGDAEDMRTYADLLDKVEAVLLPAYAQKTGKTTDEIAAMLADETWMSGAECLAQGFADQVTPAVKAMACIQSKRTEEFKKMPESIRNMITPPRNSAPRVQDDEPAAFRTPVQAAAPVVDENSIRAQVLAEQKARVNGINDLFAMFGGRYQTLQAQCLADPECSLEQAREKLLNEMGRESTPSNKNTPAHIYAGNGNFVGDGIRQALMARAGFEKTERDNVYNGMTLREYARMSLTERGIGVSSYNPMQMVGAAFTHSTSDFGNILLDVANKAILQGWEDAPETYEQWTRKGQLSDFKIAHRVGMGGFSALRQVREGAEYKYVTTGDKQATIALATYGELFSITRQAIINDDLNMLTDVPMKLGRAAKSTIADLVYAILTSNPKISTDNVSLFDKAKHANVLESAAMDVASLDKARQLMRVQKEGERHLNIRPAFVLVPTAMESVANQVIRSSSVKGADINAGIINPVKDFATVIAEPRLDDNSQTTFYLAASKGSDTIEVAYLNGVDTPYIDQMEGFSVDGVTTKVRIDAGVAPVDHRGLVKCTA